MSVLYPDPSLPSNPAPIFSDTNAARGDEMRANNNKIWGNFTDFDSRAVVGDNEHGSVLSTNLDAIVKSGFYTCLGTATGAPNTTYSWLVLHQNSALGTASEYQRAVAFDTTLIVYERMKISSTWGAWKKTHSEPTDVLSVSISTADVTLTETPPDTIVLSGALTGTRTLTLPTSVKTYRIINNCTNAQYVVIIKPSGGTGYYSCPKDRIQVYCDGSTIDICGGEPADVDGAERKTARFYLGAQIYKKLVHFGLLPNNATTTVPHGISGAYTLVSLAARAGASAGNQFEIPYSSPTLSANIAMIIGITNLLITTAQDYSAFDTYVFIEYIKA